MANKKKKTIVPPPSLQPRKTTKKTIPGSRSTQAKPKKLIPAVKRKTRVTPTKKAVATKQGKASENDLAKVKKERFTLWLSEQTYKAFKIHTATRKGSSSDYIEELIKKDLGVK